MHWLLCSLIFLFFEIQQTFASGFLSIRLKSAYDQSVEVILDDEQPYFIVLPLFLQKDVEMKFENLRIDFSKTYNVTILVGDTDDLYLSSSSYYGQITPRLGSVIPSKLNLPLNGIRFDFTCDTNWSGEKCDIRCESGNSTCLTSQNNTKEINLDVTYIIKEKSFVEKLKNDYLTENSFLAKEPVHRNIAEKIDLTDGLPPIATPEDSDNGLLLEKKQKSADDQMAEFLGGASGEFPEELTFKFQ